MKHLKHLFTVLLLLFTTMATAHNFEVGSIYYNILSEENKTVEVTYRGSYSSSYDDEYTGSVVIPESVTYNGNTYSVTSIGWSAFSGCTGLTSIVIPNSVTSIGSYAFSGCTRLTSITIPNSVTSIGEWAFSGCTGLTSITIPNSVTSIGTWAFYNCSGLTSIEIPNSVTSIGDYAFYNCSGLASIVVDGNNTKYDSREDCNAIIETETNTLVSGCKNTVIPSSVTSIGEGAFYYCTGLKSIVIPNSVTNIGEYAYSNCTGLTSIEIPNSVTSIGKWAFSYCTGLISITIPNSVTSIGIGAFDGTVWYNNQPDGVVYAGKMLYKYKGSMPSNTSITIKDGTLGIADYAFNGCSGLKSVVIPNSVTSIGDFAFEDCSGLTSITIPNSVTNIGIGAFAGCSGLTSIVVDGNNTKYDSREDCNAIIETETNTLVSGCKNTVIPSGVTSIGDYAFYNCSGLTSITIPNSVTSIGYDAFSGCKGLTSITSLIHAESLFAIDSYVFNKIDKTVCTLYVPVGTKETYASTEGWKDFVNIVEKDFTGIDEVLDEVKGENRNLKTIYDLNGRAVEKPTSGVYIINGKKCWVSESND